MIWEMFQHAVGYLCLFTGAAYCSLLGYKNMLLKLLLYRLYLF